MAESQVKTIRAYLGQVKDGSCDGMSMVIVAWTPSPEELEDLKAGRPVFLTCMGSLPPHFLTTSFQEAKRVA